MIRVLLPILVVCTGSILSPTSVGGQDFPPGADPDCPVCRLWARYDEVLLTARKEVAALPDGAVYFLYSDNFRTVEQIQRFAYERQELETTGAARRHPRTQAPHGPNRLVQVQVAASAHGMFAILTSDRPRIVHRLREEASQAVRYGTLVRF